VPEFEKYLSIARCLRRKDDPPMLLKLIRENSCDLWHPMHM
jgi:hypothetical protein